MSTSSVPETGRYRTTLTLPWHKPPLNMNDRMHWRKKATVTKSLRAFAAVAFRDIPLDLEHVTVELIWTVPDRRRRDAENPMPTLKALADGIVDAAIVPDDVPEFMTKLMPRIVYEKGVSRLQLTITEGQA